MLTPTQSGANIITNKKKTKPHKVKTVEVEITADVALAESRECWEPVGRSLSNGPRRAQSKAGMPSILRRQAHVSCREYDGIPKRAGRIFLKYRNRFPFGNGCFGKFPEARWHRGV